MSENPTRKLGLLIIVVVFVFFGLVVFLPIALVAPRVLPIILAVFIPMLLISCIFIYIFMVKSPNKTNSKRVRGIFTVPDLNVRSDAFSMKEDSAPQPLDRYKVKTVICSFCGLEVPFNLKICPICGGQLH